MSSLRFKSLFLTFILIVLCCPASVLLAQDDVPATPASGSGGPGSSSKTSFLDTLQFSGFLDGYYGYNFNSPASRKTGLRNFDFNHNQFSLSLVELAIERQASPAGFRIDLGFGETAKFVHSAEPAGTDVYQYLQQAYVSYRAPQLGGLQFDVGKFVTQHGAEVIEAKDNWNYSRSLLFAWAIPYYHFGVRASYPLNDNVSVGAFLVNGWNNVVENNGSKTVGVQAIVKPSPKLMLIQNYMTGPEQASNNTDRRHLVDTTVVWDPMPALSFMANYDYGMDRALGDRVRWQGIAGYTRWTAKPWLRIASRYEWFDDPQGFSTGAPQSLREATLTSEFSLQEGLLVRAEFRRDWSNVPFFEQRGSVLARNQETATLGFVYVFNR